MKTHTSAATSVLFFWVFSMIQPVYASMNSDVVGRILLQVEEHGETWYVAPETEERVYIRNGDAAYAALRTFGLGISNENLEAIPIGIEERFDQTDSDGDDLPDVLEDALGTDSNESDSDGDGYSDGVEVVAGYSPTGLGNIPINTNLISRLSGYILLQVESHGEAWYVNPADGKRYYMTDGDAAFEIMRYLSLGITNSNLSEVPLFSSTLDCSNSIDCFLGAIQSDIAADVTYTTTLPLLGIELVTTSFLTHRLPNNQELYTYESEVLSQTADGVEQEEAVGLVYSCTYDDKDDLAEVVVRWIQGSYSTSDFDFATCSTTLP